MLLKLFSLLLIIAFMNIENDQKNKKELNKSNSI